MTDDGLEDVLPHVVKAAAQAALARSYRRIEDARASLARVEPSRRNTAQYRRLEADLDAMTLEHRDAVTRLSVCPPTLAALTAALDASRPRPRLGGSAAQPRGADPATG